MRYETLGRAAYFRTLSSRLTGGERVRLWDKLPDKKKRHWREIAGAVLKEIAQTEFSYDYGGDY